jgi:pimeloyl-ACP methyl ester carboxylesterase
MSLTGIPFLLLLCAGAVAAFALVVLRWDAAATGRPGDLVRRVAMLLTVNLLVLLAIGALANRTFDFFSDWSDLSGTLAATAPGSSLTHGAVSRAEARSLPFPSVAGGRGGHLSTPLRLPRDPFAGGDGQLLTYQVRGGTSGLVAPVTVWLPPDYAAQVASGHRLPVIEAFSGYPGSTLQWFHSIALPSIYEEQVAAHRLRDAVVVSPSTEIPPGTDTECVDGGPGAPQVERFLTVDVPTWVRQHFAVVPRRTSWMTMGLSAGGWCAAMAALRHPAQYGAAVVMGGYFAPDFSAGYRPLAPGAAAGYDLVRLEQRRRPPVALWLETSRNDRLSYPSSAAFLRAVAPPTAVQATVLQDGGHRLSLWRPMLGSALDWVGARIPGFRPLGLVAALHR